MTERTEDSQWADGETLTADDLVDTFARRAIWGTGASGAWTSAGAETLAAGVHHYTSFNLQNGHTLTTTAANNKLPLIILVDGNATIAGTVSLAGKGQTSGTTYGAVGAMTSKTILDGPSPIVGDRVNPGPVSPVNPGAVPYTDAATEDMGGPGGQTAISHYLTDAMYTISPLDFRWMLNGAHGLNGSGVQNGGGGGGGASAINAGSNGTSGAGGGVASTERAGGDGGCSFILICRGNLTVSGTITVSGNAGTNGSGTNNAGGGGGGSGIIFLAYGGTLTDSGTYNNAAGAGGTATGGGGAGGAGGAGNVYKISFDSLISLDF